MPSDVDPFDDEDMYSVDYNDEAISIGLDSDHVISDSSGSDVSDLGGTNSDGESQHLSGIMCDKTILQMERLQNDSENIFVMAKALCDSQGIVLSSDNKEVMMNKGDWKQQQSKLAVKQMRVSGTQQMRTGVITEEETYLAHNR
ncbi:hypothetical protein EDB83DRAFT_2324982 [Lactarius deliciosus]|nr:hypothetical protein EDB83DRAFT_2324982 [Lactarius deliciosus]